MSRYQTTTTRKCLYCVHVCENCACRSSLWRKFPYGSVVAILLNLLQENDKHVSVLRIGWLFLVDTWISRTRSGNHKYRMRKILHVYYMPPVKQETRYRPQKKMSMNMHRVAWMTNMQECIHRLYSYPSLICCSHRFTVHLFSINTHSHTQTSRGTIAPATNKCLFTYASRRDINGMDLMLRCI